MQTAVTKVIKITTNWPSSSQFSFVSVKVPDRNGVWYDGKIISNEEHKGNMVLCVEVPSSFKE